MTYTPPPFPAGIAPGKSKPSAKNLQGALKMAGYLGFGVQLSDMYGPLTQDGVRAFHAANPAYGSPTENAIGPLGWAHLFTQAYGGAPKPSATGEPPADYTRVTYGGRTVNVRTRVLLERARVKLGLTHELRLIQGSYSHGVSASAGTHDGGGVVDVDPTQASSHNEIIKALREVGFAAWYRTPAEGFSYHIHACAIGDGQMAPAARSQVVDYFHGLNGLATRRSDTAPASVGRPYPSWAARYK